MKLHIDIETYSSIDIRTSGLYRYTESIDFEILMVAYAIDDDPVQIVDLARGEELPERFVQALTNPLVEKHAHNATFERQCFKQYGYEIPIEQWYCTAVKAAYCGLPLALGQVSKVMGFSDDKAKLATGKALIKYFCMPCRPTKVNGQRKRNFWHHDKYKWEEFKRYCIQDVEAEREIDNRLIGYKINGFERANYLLDQKINDRGILIDTDFAQTALRIDNSYSSELSDEMKLITGIDNPNSPAQLKKWISSAIGEDITTLAKATIDPLIEAVGPGPVSDALELRKKLSKSSTKKYVAMENCVCSDDRARGLFQFQGANRTGRWAGRLIQLQNLPRNYINKIEEVREVVASGDFELVKLMFDDVSDILSQLIRTSFVASEGYTYSVADFSAIEARVTAWLANERWRLEVFSTHGKIYEASASMMFGVPVEQITKGSELRTKGKIAELALGYQGALGALRKMGGEKMGLSDDEMTSIVKKWRKANRKIVDLWKNVEESAIKAMKYKKKVIGRNRGLEFEFDGYVFTIKLPSGRKLFYQEPQLAVNRFGKECLQYKGMIQTTRQWDYIDTYGGKLVENIVQAISRDILAYSMDQLDKAGFDIVMHVHDEAIAEVKLTEQNEQLERMCSIMGQEIPWAEGLPLEADGYITPFYKKD